MSNLGLVAIGAAMSQLAIMALLLIHGRKTNRTRLLFGLLLFATFCYLVAPLLEGRPSGSAFATLSSLIPGTFWLFSASLFDDHFEMRSWQWSLVLFSVAAPAGFLLLGSPAGWSKWILSELPQAMEFGFLGLALFAIFRNWRDDLLVARRNLRLWFCGILGIFILLLILAREVLFAGAHWLEAAQYVATSIVLLGTNFILVKLVPGLLDPIQRSQDRTQPASEPEVDNMQAQLEPLLKLVQEEGIHREYGMTIGKLATLAGVPEYRLRQLINSGMGFRNFNDFLNTFRIREASRRLVSPEEIKLPVLTIALDVGFRSISSFNKAFKDTHGMTPTAFRKQNVPDRKPKLKAGLIVQNADGFHEFHKRPGARSCVCKSRVFRIGKQESIAFMRLKYLLYILTATAACCC